jgi:integrase
MVVLGLLGLIGAPTLTRKPRRKAPKTTVSQLQSATNRLKLKPQTRAYFVKVAASTWLGYRKPLSGPGSWVARAAAGGDGKGWEKTLWTADDAGTKANGDKVLTFWQAKSEVQKLTGHVPGTDASTTDHGAAVTVDQALNLYEGELRRRGARVYNAQLPRCHLSATLLSKPVTLVTKPELEGFRESMLAKGNAPSSANRVMNCLRAALTHADGTRLHIWRSGLKALPDATEANNVVFEDEATAQQWVAAAYAHDHQLGLLTHVVGETGARPSQAVRLRIRDLITVDAAAPRLMMPKSGKGGTRHPGQRKIERYAVAISPELATLLKAAVKGRPGHAPLLLRNNGQPWSEIDPASQYRRDVRAVVERIGLEPDVYGLYAFRHTSITRMLLKGTHTAIVAKAHDTSEAMIRKHYAACILDFSDAITRNTLPALGPVLPPAGRKVIPLKR